MNVLYGNVYVLYVVVYYSINCWYWLQYAYYQMAVTATVSVSVLYRIYFVCMVDCKALTAEENEEHTR